MAHLASAISALLLALALLLGSATAAEVVLVGLSNRCGGRGRVRGRCRALPTRSRAGAARAAPRRSLPCRQCNAAARLNLDGGLWATGC